MPLGKNSAFVEPNESKYLPPSRIEIAEQIKRLKNHKPPGENGIQVKILKNLDEEAISSIYILVLNFNLKFTINYFIEAYCLKTFF